MKSRSLSEELISEEIKDNKADEITKKLVLFRLGASNLELRLLISIIWDLIKNSIPIILQVISSQIVNTIGYLVIRFTEDLNTQSSFGFVVTFQSLGFLMLVKSVEELMGIKVSEYFSSKK